MKTIETWAEYFLLLADVIRLKSKDASTKVGALIVNDDHTIMSTGFNGLPRGVAETPERVERPMKYSWTEHAERNAVYNAARSGSPTVGATMYTSWHPCTDCARAIVQAGISVVVVHDDPREEISAEWRENFLLAKDILKAGGVRILLHMRTKQAEVKESEP